VLQESDKRIVAVYNNPQIMLFKIHNII